MCSASARPKFVVYRNSNNPTLSGPAVRMDYSKSFKAGVSPTIQDYELQAIMTANTPEGATWKQIAYNNPDSPNKGLSKLFEPYFGSALGEKMWQRSDGA